MAILTHNKGVTSSIKDDQIGFYFIPSNPNLLSMRSSFSFNTQRFEDLMAEGYLAMADEHAKLAEITFKAISEVVP